MSLGVYHFFNVGKEVNVDVVPYPFHFEKNKLLKNDNQGLVFSILRLNLLLL